MPLEEYARGQEDKDETYCWWLEFNSPNLGSISGGSARKHLVYNRSSDPGWYYPDEYDNAKDAWEAIRAAFLRAFDLAEDGDLEAIDEIEALSSGGTVTSKTITVYFPGTKIPIHSNRHLRHFLDKLGLEEAYSRADGPFRLNKLLLDELRSYSALEDWSVKELERFLYTCRGVGTENTRRGTQCPHGSDPHTSRIRSPIVCPHYRYLIQGFE
jgi:5-methylcytosine-specific restriction protein B